MATFKETREILLASYASNIITIEEYALLFEENSSNNLDFPYYNYPPFNLESQSCETAVPVASKIKISLKQFLRKTVCELNCRKIQHSAGKGLKINLNILGKSSR